MNKVIILFFAISLLLLSACVKEEKNIVEIQYDCATTGIKIDCVLEGTPDIANTTKSFSCTHDEYSTHKECVDDNINNDKCKFKVEVNITKDLIYECEV